CINHAYTYLSRSDITEFLHVYTRLHWPKTIENPLFFLLNFPFFFFFFFFCLNISLEISNMYLHGFTIGQLFVPFST
ncbi:uncharacterized protein BX663DRAFT_424924, partial [Cokeromyces recurvatus]|uniref:uncharacterized protein n=1 Tax=Cokeromyces recurvatus TaxID=90255 RepID=UPI00221EF02B